MRSVFLFAMIIMLVLLAGLASAETSYHWDNYDSAKISRGQLIAPSYDQDNFDSRRYRYEAYGIDRGDATREYEGVRQRSRIRGYALED